jgi:hypothetical protein
MTKLEELIAAYTKMKDDSGYMFSKAIHDNIDGEESWQLIFDLIGIGVEYSFSYVFFVDNDPRLDEIVFYGDNDDNEMHFLVSCYFSISDFIQALQKYRSDKDTINALIEYLEGDEGKLSPCPFCGFDHRELSFVTIGQDGYRTLGIFCHGCRQTVIVEENECDGDTKECREKAIAAWNRRVELP